MILSGCLKLNLSRCASTLQALLRKMREAESRRRPEPELPRMAMRPPMMGGKGMPMAPKGRAYAVDFPEI